jgi:GH24 family phage-related lysozyme (muramidase)
MFKPSKELIEFIKKKEGLRLKPYKDFDGRPAVGFGDTSNVTGQISELEAEQRLVKRLEQGGELLAKTVTRKDLSQGQIDSLLDMEYNIGMGNLQKQGFIDLVNTASDSEIVSTMGKFTKAKNKQGEFKELPGLVERSKARQQMWGGSVSTEAFTNQAQGGVDIFSGASSSDIDSALKNINIAGVETKQPSLDEALQNVTITTPKPIDEALAGINLAGELNEDPAYVSQRERAKSFSQQEKIPFDQAEALIFERDPKIVKLRQQAPQIAKSFPPLAKWASAPENFKKLADGPQMFTQLVVAAKPYNPSVMDDLKRLAKENVWMYEEAYISAASVLGAMDPNKARAALKEINTERANTPYAKYGKGLEKISKELSETKAAIIEEGSNFLEALSNAFSDDGQILENLKKAYQAGKITASQVFELMGTLKDNPQAFTILGLQSLSSMALPLAGRLAGGAAGAAAGPAGVIVGQQAGATLASGLLGFGTELRQQLEEFKDPDTGEIDVPLAVSDPKRVSKWKNLAAQYGLTMGVVDGLFTGLAGKYVSQGTGIIGKATGIVKGGAVQAVGEGVSEGAGQVQAASVAQFYGEPFTLEKGLEIVGNAFEEGLVSIASGGVIEGAAGAISTAPRAVRTTKEAIAKTLNKKQKATEAEQSYQVAQNLRQKLEAIPNLSDDDAKDLIQQVVQVDQPSVIGSADDVDVDTEADAIFQQMLTAASQGQIDITAKDFDAYFRAQGIDPVDVLQRFDPKTVELHIKAKEDGGSFPVPVQDWFVNTKEFPNIDAIARFNGNELNALQGTTISQQLEQNPFQLLEETGNEPPPVPEEQFPPVLPAEFIDDTGRTDKDFIQVSGDEGSDLVLRQVELTSRFRDKADQNVFSDMVNRLKASTKEAGDINEEQVELIAELEFEHFKYRSRILGKPISELYAVFGIGKTSKAGSKGVFSRVKGYGNPYRVAFNWSADAKTLIHELGHSWLHELSEDYVILSAIPETNRTPEQVELLNLMDVLAKEYQARGFDMDNIGELYNRTKDEVTAIHEIFSQTTERWAYEASTENNRLKYIMEAFRKWLVKLGDIINRTYPEYPSFEINPELNRLFTTITNADKAVNEQLLPMFPEPEFPAGFLGKDEDKYMNAYRDARSEAIGSFISKAMFADFKTRDAAIKKAINDITDKATQEIDNLPSMQILQSFISANDQRKKGEIDFEPRISAKSFRAFFANDNELEYQKLRDAIPTKDIIGKENKGGGQDAAVVMQQLGINSKEEMISLMKEMGMRDELIKKRVDELIEQDFPVMKSDEEMHKAAVEALNASGKEKLLNTTFNILKDKYPAEFKRLIEKGMLPQRALGTKDVKQFLKDKALTEILNKSVVGFNPLRLMDDSDRLGKDAASMFRRGNIEEAMDLKYKQSLLFYQAQAGLAVLKEIARVQALKKKIIKTYGNDQKVKDQYDVDILQYTTEIIQLSVKDFRLPFLDVSKISTFSGVLPSQVADINMMVQKVSELGRARFGINTSIETELAFGDLLNTLYTTARKAKEVEVQGKKMLIRQARAQVVEQVGEPTKRDPKLTKSQIKDFAVVSLWHRKNLSSISLDTMFSSLFPSDEAYAASTLGQLMNAVKEAEAKRNDVLNDARLKINTAAKKAYGKKGVLEMVAGLVTDLPFIGEDGAQPIALSEFNVTLDNKAELLTFLAHTLGSESGLENVMLGGVKNSGPLGGYDPVTGKIDTTKLEAMVERLITDGTLTKEDFEFLQVLWDAFDSMYPELKKTQREINGKNVGYIEGRGVKNSIFQGRGGYIPIRKAEDLDPTKGALFLDPGAGDMMSALIPPISKGSTISRIGPGYDVDLDLSRVISKLNSVANLAYVYPSMVSIGKVFAQREVQQSLENRRPGIVEYVIYPWFKRTSLQQYTEPADQLNIYNSIARTLRSNIPIVFYLGKAAAGAKQLIGAVQAIPVVGFKNVLIGTARFVSNPASALREMRELSPRMDSRAKKGQTQLLTAMDDLNINFTTYKMLSQASREASFFIIQAMQNITDAIVWHGAYHKALKTQDPKTASTVATNAVEKTQGSTGVSGLANIQYGGEIAKLLTQLTTVPLALRGVQYEGGARNESNMRRLAFYMNFTAWAIIAASSLEQVVNAARKELTKNIEGEEDEDEKKRMQGFSDASIEQEKFENFMLSMAGQGLESVFPVMGRNITALAMFGKAKPSPAADTLLRNTSIAAGGIKDQAQGIDMTGDQVVALLNVFTLMTGIPLTLADFGLSLIKGQKTEDEKLEEKFIRREQRRENRIERMSR